MSDRLFALRLFLRVARTRSFSKAGREFGLSQPSASRILAELEREVGTALLTRTTRAVTLTDAGSDYLARIEPLLAALDDADQAARGCGDLRGNLRIGVSTGFGIRELIPRLRPFLERHPALKVDLVMADQRQDLVGDGVDMVFRFGTLPDSSAKRLHLGATPRLLSASPDYVARAGLPKKPEDLKRHDLIIGPAGMMVDHWTLRKGTRKVVVKLQARVSVSAHEGMTAAALAGLGIISTGLWGCRQELMAGTLVQILPDWEQEPLDVNAVFVGGRTTKPAARALAEYLAAALKD